jgi:hypothetical protein
MAKISRFLLHVGSLILSKRQLAPWQSTIVVCLALVYLGSMILFGICAIFIPRPVPCRSLLWCLVDNPECSTAVATWVAAFGVTLFSLDRVLISRAKQSATSEASATNLPPGSPGTIPKPTSPGAEPNSVSPGITGAPEERKDAATDDLPSPN